MDEATPPVNGWRELAESMLGGVAIQVDEEFAYVTEELASIVGTDADSLTGRPWQTLFDRNESDRLERTAVSKARTKGRWEGKARTGDRGAGGTPVEIALSATETGNLVWAVSERSAIPAERNDGSDRYQSIVEAVGDGVYALDENLQFSFVNDEMCEMFGRPENELLGTDPRTLFVDADQLDIAADMRERVVSGDLSTGTVEAVTETPDGDRLELESYYRLRAEPADGEFPGTVGVIRDVTERNRRERTLERQRDELETLDRINELLLETTRELIQTATRETVERTVCEQLAASDLYRFVWVGEREFDGNRIVPRVTAGDDREYLDEVTITDTKSETGQGPVGRALRSNEVTVANVDDSSFEHWRDAARERGFESVIAVPLRDEETVYGVMVVYATREDAFSEREQAGFDVLGRTVGSVISAAKSRELLFADAVVELEFRVEDSDTVFVQAASKCDCELELDGYVPSAGRWILYLSVTGGHPVTVAETMANDERVERAKVIGDEGGDGRIELVVAESSFLHTVTGVGATVQAASADSTSIRLVVEAPDDGEIRDIVDQMLSVYSDAELLAHRERDREITTVGRPGGVLDDLTDRQRESVRVAYRSGYFDWPRESTAEEIAESLDISSATLHGHIRKAERTILSALIDDD